MPGTLSREQIVKAAIGMADENGIDALSMRKLGRALGVEAMSLYNHVSGKDDLLDGMVNQIWEEITLPPPRGDWRAAIRKTAVSAHKSLLRHPWACYLTISSGRIREARMRYINAILGRLRKADLPPALAFHGYHAIDSHIIGFSMWANGHSESANRRDEQVTATALRNVPEDYPHLGEHIQHHRTGIFPNRTDEFTFILDFILDGLDQASRPSSAVTWGR